MEKEIVNLVKKHSGGSNELVFDFEVPMLDTYNSIEVFGENKDKVRMNAWYTDNGEECEHQQKVSELSTQQQTLVHNLLKEQLKEI